MKIYKVKALYDSCNFCCRKYFDENSIEHIRPDYLYEIKRDDKRGLTAMVCQDCVDQLSLFGNSSTN